MTSATSRPPRRVRSLHRNARIAASILTAGTLVWVMIAARSTSAADTSWHAPTTTGSPSNEWTNPSNAFVRDNVYATASSDGADQSYGGFGFSIPPGSSIGGITVEIDAARAPLEDDKAWQLQVRLSWDAGAHWTDYRDTGALVDSLTTYTLGGSSDPWARTWDPSELDDANFRLEIRSDRIDPFGVDAVAVDQIRVLITYETPSPSPSPSPSPEPSPSPSPSPTPTQEVLPSATPTPTPTAGNLPAAGTPPVTPPATDVVTRRGTGVPGPALVVVALAALTSILLAFPAELRRRR
ncbi:MAG: hypothetical protein KatS3mg065_1038 [Chloroflexota bacterium]|nr:MAG: hypothetical protein KatS3mg065_1038 [Chloroflexota bacterium]